MRGQSHSSGLNMPAKRSRDRVGKWPAKSNTAPRSKQPSALATVARPPTEYELAEYVKKVAEITKRPARRQAKEEQLEQTQKVFEGTYNIWYNKWTGQKHKGRFEIGERAPTKVKIERDSGYSLADKRRAQNPSYRTNFCLLFARGCCPTGHKCEYLHRIPLPLDHEENTKDCFGRERHRDEREDMNGVGCFNRENKTIYIGNMNPYHKNEGEKIIRRNFEPYGEIDKINVIADKAIAFVKFKKRACAEFAKEAMEHQTLDSGEIISIRWAYDDPNPRVVTEEKRKVEQTFVEHFIAKKARSGETEHMDEETKTLIAAHPQYAQYQYVEISEEPLYEISNQKPMLTQAASGSDQQGLITTSSSTKSSNSIVSQGVGSLPPKPQVPPFPQYQRQQSLEKIISKSEALAKISKADNENDKKTLPVEVINNVDDESLQVSFIKTVDTQVPQSCNRLLNDIYFSDEET